MTSVKIRERLYDYIRVADDKKIKAIYMMLEDEVEEVVEWWKDKEFTKQLDKEFQDWKSGKVKGISKEGLDKKIDKL